MTVDEQELGETMNELKETLATLSLEERTRLENSLFTFVAPPPATRIPRRPLSAQPLLSFAQQQAWLIQQLAPDSAFYNRPNVFRLSGNLNRNALQAAVDGIRQRHETLHTRYPTAHGVPIQQICDFKPLAISLVDLRDLPPADRETHLQAVLRAETLRPFNLAQELPQRVILYRLREEEHVLLLVTHHIATDYLSGEIFQREFCLLYNAACQGASAPLPALPIQYADYALWQRDMLETGRWQKHVAYWQAQLAGELPILDLPTDHPRPSAQAVTETYAGANERITLPLALIHDLRRLSRNEKVTLFTTVFTAFSVLLHYYAGQEDLIIGTPFANRTEVELEGLIGFFANPLPLRSNLSGDPTIGQLLARNHQVTIGAYDHQALPFEKIVEAIRPVREPGRPVIYQAFLRFLETPEPEYTLPGLVVSRLAVEKGIAEFDILLDLTAIHTGFQATLHYRADLFAATTIQRMLAHFHNILQAMVEAPNLRLSQLPILSAAEKQQLLYTWNQTDFANPPTLLHELIEAHCQTMPNQIALIYRQDQLTYAALNQAANQLAHFLRGKGVGEETLVAIYMHRTPQVIIALLAVIKAGGAFLLLDPTWPAERLSTILKQGQVSFVLTNQAAAGGLTAVRSAGVTVDAFCLDTLRTMLQQESTQNLHHPQPPDALAYVVYTSGSTGEPKGVMGTHQALVNYVLFYARLVALSPKDRRLQFASVSSELLLAEVFCTLGGGATLILRPDDNVSAIEEFLCLLDRYQITITGLPVAYWHQWTQVMAEKAVAIPPSLRVVVTGMDRVQTEPFKIWQEKIGSRIAWYNVYGPAETTCVSTCYKADSATAPTLTRIPIGRPISNVTHYVLDAQMRPVSIGIPGELYIGGMGVTRGYLNQPELTAERFVVNPFGPGRLYRTGDFVRYLASGDLEFIGRRDQQVKIRGYRVELSEVESALNQHPAVQQSVVIRVERNSTDQHLVAYWVAQAPMTATPVELSAWLKARLPVYMIPTRFVLLASLPLTSNGKVDRRALPAPDFSLGQDMPTSDAPRTLVEQRLVELWRTLLPVEQIGIHDNFFALGGHSLLAVRLMMQVEQSFHREIVLRNFIFTPTIAHLATLLDAPPTSASDSTPPSSEEAMLNLSAQSAIASLPLYEQLQAPDAFRRLRQSHRRPQVRSRLDRSIKRLPQPLAFVLLRQLARSRWAQQRYWAKEVALIHQFYAILDTAVTSAQMVENSLFYNLLHRYSFDRRFALSPTQPVTTRSLVQMRGLMQLEITKGRGTGVILATQHTLARYWLRLHEISEYNIFGINEVVEREQLDKAQVAPILFARQLELATQTLRRGGVIGLAPDGYQGSGPERTMPFHGRLRYFRTTFAELALLTGASILPLWSEMQPGQPITMHILPSLDAGDAYLPDAVRIEQLSDQYLQHLDRAWRTMPWMLPWSQMEKHLACAPVG